MEQHLSRTVVKERRTKRLLENKATHSTTSDYIEPMRRANIERMLKAKKIVGAPFSSSGNNNKQRQRLFSQFDHKHSGGDLKPLVDHNGVPTQTHRGLTGLRARSLPEGYTAVGLPGKNTRMDFTKSFEWMPDPVDVPHHPTNGMSRNRKWARHTLTSVSHVTPNSFSFGYQAKPALFNPIAQPQAPNNSAEEKFNGDIGRYSKVSHGRAFSASAIGRGASDQYISNHPEYQYRPSQFSTREEIYQATTNSHGPGNGFRYTQGLVGNNVLSTSSQAPHPISFRTGLPVRSAAIGHVSGTDRGSRFVSTVTQENLDFHRSQQLRKSNSILQKQTC